MTKVTDSLAYDCHCHILPGIDDGAADLAESLDLCRWFVAHGISEVVCTSHSTRRYPNTAETVEAAAAALQAELDKRGIALHLIPSLEYRFVPQTWPPKRLLPWKGNHILVELSLKHPEKMAPLDPVEEIRRLVREGYQPVLAHPERYLWSTPGDYDRWLAAGALFQRNLGSLGGFYGSPAQERARYLQQKGLYSFLGSDLHNRHYAEFFDTIIDLEPDILPRKQVVAAIIRKGDRIFATQRGYGEWKDWWEFPGGKIEAGETPEAALVREIREELSAEISIDRLLHTVEWDYPTFHLTMNCYLCALKSEALHLNEHEAARWLDKTAIHSVKWLPADEQLLPLIIESLAN